MQEICEKPLFDAKAAERAVSEALCTASSVELTLLVASLRSRGVISADEIVRRSVKTAATQELLLCMLESSVDARPDPIVIAEEAARLRNVRGSGLDPRSGEQPSPPPPGSTTPWQSHRTS